jgi:hypothetical protein
MSCRNSPRNDFCFSLNHPDDQAGSAVGTQPEVLESMRHASSGYALNIHPRFGAVILVEKKEFALPEITKCRAAVRVGTFRNHK